MNVMPGKVVRCPRCGARNRVPQGKDLPRARCGRCSTAFSQWSDQPDAIRTAQQVNERQPGPAKSVGATRERLTSPAAIRALLLAFALPLAAFTAVYHLFEFGDLVGALLLILLAAPMAAFLLPGVRDSGGRFVLFLGKALPATGVASLAISALFLTAEPDLTAAAGDVLGHIAALPGKVAAKLKPAPPPPEPELVRTQLTVIDDILDLLDD